MTKKTLERKFEKREVFQETFISSLIRSEAAFDQQSFSWLTRNARSVNKTEKAEVFSGSLFFRNQKIDISVEFSYGLHDFSGKLKVSCSNEEEFYSSAEGTFGTYFELNEILLNFLPMVSLNEQLV